MHRGIVRREGEAVQHEVGAAAEVDERVDVGPLDEQRAGLLEGAGGSRALTAVRERDRPAVVEEGARGRDPELTGTSQDHRSSAHGPEPMGKSGLLRGFARRSWAVNPLLVGRGRAYRGWRITRPERRDRATRA
ncbi:hypothetical protein GCM10009792_08850 [Microcella alkalica]